MYPRDFLPRHNRGDIYMTYGDYQKALATELDALRVDPNNGFGYGNLVLFYLSLDRLQDADAAVREATTKHFESAVAGTVLYFVAFLHNDEKGMEQQVLWGKNSPGDEDWMLSLHSDTAAYHGRLSKARELSAEAVISAINAHERETAANWQANEALREAEFGNRKRAQQAAKEALKLFPGIDAQSLVAMTYARIGETSQAQQLIDALTRAHPNDTMLGVYWRPTILAAAALQRGRPAEAIALLQNAAPYELGATAPTGQITSLYPAYLRGEAYLALGQPKQAAEEFHKYLEHRGAV
jgi:tetratricopeptide (TPR) repeat protein